MRISIAMATYNGVKYLQEQLDSILYQTRHPDELVVCDDGSTDGTLEMLGYYSKKFEFDVVVLSNKSNLGVSRNFEKAISMCTGDIIFLSDQDDVWKKEKIQQIEDVFLKDRLAQIVINDALIVDEQLKPCGTSVLQQTLALNGSANEFVHGCCTAFRKTYRDLCLPFPSMGGRVVGHDDWLHNVGTYLEVRRVVATPYQYYRRHQNNASNSKISAPVRLNHIDRILDSIQKLSKFLNDDLTHLQFLEHTYFNVNLLEERALNCHTVEHYEEMEVHRMRLNKLKRGLAARMELAKMSKAKRFIDASKFYFDGGYQSFSGWKSFVVDILKPQQDG